MSPVNSPLFEWFFSGCCVFDNLSVKPWEVGGRSSTLTLGAFGKGNDGGHWVLQLGKLSPALIFCKPGNLSKKVWLNGKRDKSLIQTFKFDTNLQVWYKPSSLMIDDWWLSCVVFFPSNEFNLHSATQKFINKNTRRFTWWKYRWLHELVSFFRTFLSVIFFWDSWNQRINISTIINHSHSQPPSTGGQRGCGPGVPCALLPNLGVSAVAGGAGAVPSQGPMQLQIIYHICHIFYYLFRRCQSGKNTQRCRNCFHLIPQKILGPKGSHPPNHESLRGIPMDLAAWNLQVSISSEAVSIPLSRLKEVQRN